VGQIRGGTAHNITAKDCHFMVDFRVVPNEDQGDWEARLLDKIAEVEAEMKAVHPDAAIRYERYFGIPGLKPESDGVAERLVRTITGDNGTHVVSYGTEAGQFQERGYSALVCGPGDIAQAHQPNEFITVAQLEAGEAFVSRVIDQLCR
jgi:acetylornithine deacetylase